MGAWWPKMVQMLCAIIPAGVKGFVGWGLDKPGELMSDSLISTDNSSAIGLAIAAFFPVL